MKIVHICLANFYVDGMGYQENILPKYHSNKHDVSIITSDYSFNAFGEKTRKVKKEYYNEFKIRVNVLEKSRRYGIYSKYGDFKGLYDMLCKECPDIIFCHGGQFVALKDVIRYCKKNKEVKLFIDQHADYYNTPVDTFRRRLAQYLIYGFWMRKAAPFVEKFWGVTPWRCEYLKDVYRLPENKIDFLPMGGDDDKIDFKRKEIIKKKIREENDIDYKDFLIITGGKINKAKNIDLLIRAVNTLNKDDLKILVFGQANTEIKDEIEELCKDSHVRYIGWIEPELVYDYFLASDLAVFPGTHSVLWEQSCACGIPGIFREWPGMKHIDVGGNCIFIREVSIDEIQSAILSIYNNREKLEIMKNLAEKKATGIFSYREIAKKAILERD